MELHLTDNDRPIKVDGETKISVSFEEGDIFVNADGQYGIILILDGRIVYLRLVCGQIVLAHNFLSDEWNKNWRFCGSESDSEITTWEDSLNLYEIENPSSKDEKNK